MHKRYLIYAVGAALVVLGAGCSKNATVNTNNEETVNAASVNEGSNSSVNENENSNANRSTNEDRNTNEDSNTNSNRDTNTNEDHQQVSSGSLKVTSPETNAAVESLVELEGTSDTDKVYVRAKSSTGGTIFTESVTVRDGEFKVKLTLSLTTSKKVIFEVFQKDANGSEVNLVSVPVTVKIESASTNSNTNSSVNDNINENENSNDNLNSSLNINY